MNGVEFFIITLVLKLHDKDKMDCKYFYLSLDSCIKFQKVYSVDWFPVRYRYTV